MSCLVAILNADGAPVDEHVLRAMLDVPPYGDAAARVQIHGSVGLGQVPLLHECGSDPNPGCASVRTRVSGVMDGRFDDRDTLVRALERHASHRLAAASDLELLLYAYDAWGAGCVDRLVGDFAFCLWDHRRRRLFCGRDRFGVKPLYYAHVGRTLVVANVLNSVKRHPNATSAFDDRAVGDFLLFGFAFDECKTLFADVSRVPAGHHLTCDADARVRIERYWTLEPEDPIRGGDGREYVERFSHELTVAVRDRIRDGNVGILMSGGLDSSSVAATAAGLRHDAPQTVQAVTAVYDTLMPDEERRYSSLVADALRIPVRHVSVDAYETFERWDADALPPEPSTEPLTAATVDLWTAVGAHAGVVLTGDGGDSALLPSTAVSQLGVTPPVTLARDLFRSVRQLRALPPLGLRSMLKRRLSAPIESVPPWLAQPLLSRFDPQARWAEVSRQRALPTAVRGRALSDLRDPLWAATFESYDPGATGVAVEPRYPFFDVRIVSFALTLPSFPWCINKEILRRAMRGRLPDAITMRRKAPLVADPAVVHHRWSHVETMRLLETTPEVSQYVDVGKFAAAVRDGSTTVRSPGVLAALALAKWLHCSSRGRV